MNLAPSDDGHHLVSRLLQRERLRDEVGLVARELDRALVTEEIRRVEHEDMECMTLDPLTAVEEAAQGTQLASDLDTARVLHRLHRAHLVRDRADAADAGRDVGRLGEGAAAKEGLEEPRRLVDVELHLVDPAVLDLYQHRAFTLDAREVVGLDRHRAALSHRRTAPPRTPGR